MRTGALLADMHPILFRFAGVTIYSYGVLVAIGVILGLWYARWQARRAGVNPEKVWNLGIYMICAALLGSKLWLVLSAGGYYWAHPADLFSAATLQSGGAFYGGVLGAIAMIAGYGCYQNLRFLPLFDVFSAALPLGHAIGRLGCLMAGCCYGRPTSLPWGIRFTSDAAARIAGTPLNEPLHPTQLYEAGAEFLNFLFLIWLGKRQRFSGQIFGAYLMLYGTERGTIEFFRGDPGRTLMFHGAVSLMQIVSLALILVGAYLWWRGLRRNAMTPVAAGQN